MRAADWLRRRFVFVMAVVDWGLNVEKRTGLSFFNHVFDRSGVFSSV